MPKKNTTFSQLCEEQRKQISRWIKEKKKKAEIARLLNVHRSTIGREFKNNQELLGGAIPKRKYSWEFAQHNHVSNKRKCGAKCKIRSNPELIKYIEEQVIKKKWSPYVAIEFARTNNLHKITFTDRSVYNWVKKKLIKITPHHLRYSLRRKRYVKQQTKKNKKDMGGISISKRPEIINARQEFGHWEIDCICDGNNNAILVMQERLTRWFVMAKLEKYDSHFAVRQVAAWFGKFGVAIKSITADNGYEFARLKELGIDIYFTHPFAPHEKGGIENLNGRIRWDIPKSISLNRYSHDQISEIEVNINGTPREILKFQSPSKLFHDMLLSNTSTCCN